ncbi:PRC-barrel domain-containing protein [Roseovarius nanhaiticus]|uniref:PRC-barrel domain-containing protein n=1 Tax=Roseovarius nanhaiticus TaxID=573024 RepID=A0A1N7EQ77_9RHOB|nr:PRC-barrel domain-containing protein [Roseovarius nanhaiticus]SEK69172.1 PRC-barrel domain-containing protein [Roseovarius nanhaiticus]SIR90247.1 PRC-barrel domain-containing protein [Roseovarius nanhaiticus]
MKRFMMTTALVMATATPAAVLADNHDAAASMFEAQSPAGETMDMKASNLIGHRLYMPEEGTDMGAMGEITDAPDNWVMAGEIDDVVIGKDGKVQDVLVDAGGFLGMGETERRVALDSIRFQPDADDEGEYFAIYTGDRKMLEETESYDEDASNEMGETLGTASWEGYGMNDGAEMQTVSFDSMTTEDLLGTTVYGGNDEWVGEISELALGDDGNVSAVILDVGGFLGIGERAVSMPMDKVELRRMGDEGDISAYVSATEEELMNMEEWTESES